jgi:hypothetical protein
MSKSENGRPVTCAACGGQFFEPEIDGAVKARPCRLCGGDGPFTIDVAEQAIVTPMAEMRAVKTPLYPDTSKPYRGRVRIYSQRRIGRDGRVVERSAVYDGEQDIAQQRVVDVETGQVLVDKTEKASEKERKRGWKRRPRTSRC